jgi:hypothetical protein
LTDILSSGESVQKDIPADSTFWEYGLEVVEKVRKKELPLFKEFM